MFSPRETLPIEEELSEEDDDQKPIKDLQIATISSTAKFPRKN